MKMRCTTPMRPTLTAKLKLHTTPEQFRALRATQLAYRDALNYLTHPRLKPGDARFCAAAYATAPRRLCPSLSMFLAALWSRWRLVPQSGQECQRTDKLLATRAPQPEQTWLVNAG
jgi:hypothetical protein